MVTSPSCALLLPLDLQATADERADPAYTADLRGKTRHTLGDMRFVCLFLLPPKEVNQFLAWADGHLSQQRAEFQVKFRPAVEGLSRAAAGRSPEESSLARRSVAGTQIVTHNVLILGASYGSLFGTKLLMAGHRVSFVCTRPTAELINREGTVVRFPIKGRSRCSTSRRRNCRARWRRPRRMRPTPAGTTCRARHAGGPVRLAGSAAVDRPRGRAACLAWRS